MLFIFETKIIIRDNAVIQVICTQVQVYILDNNKQHRNAAYAIARQNGFSHWSCLNPNVFGITIFMLRIKMKLFVQK